MKKFVLFVLLLVLAAACKKGDEAAPDAAARIAGTYDVSRLSLDAPGTTDDVSVNLPITQNGNTLSATLDVTRVTETTVRLKFTLRITGQPDDPSDLGGDVEVRGNELYEGSTKIGTANGSTLSLDATTDDGIRTVIEAKKR